MSENKQKSTGIYLAEVWRGMQKLVDEREGKIQVSDASAEYIKHLAYYGPQEYRRHFSRIGAAPKKKVGIEVATLQVLTGNPKLTHDEVWDQLRDYRIPGFEIYVQDDKIVQIDEAKNKQSEVKRSSWYGGYYLPAKKTAKSKKIEPFDLD